MLVRQKYDQKINPKHEFDVYFSQSLRDIAPDRLM